MPLTSSGEKVLENMKEEYGDKKEKKFFMPLLTKVKKVLKSGIKKEKRQKVIGFLPKPYSVL